MPICIVCGTIGGYRKPFCLHLDRRPRTTNRIRYPKPNRLGLTPKAEATR